jgi:4-hydroxybenzoate polyprenyltransferase
MIRWLLDLGRFLRFSRTVTTLPIVIGVYVVAEEGTVEPLLFLHVLLAVFLGVVCFLLFNHAYPSPQPTRVPRDRERERLFSALGPRTSYYLTWLVATGFVLNAYRINRAAFYLSPVALLALFAYVPSRRRSVLNHVLLGFIASLLVLGPYVAVDGRLTLEALTGGLAVMSWIVGFDVIYSFRDVETHREQGTASLPAVQSPGTALYTAGTFHVISVFCFFAYAVHAELGGMYLTGLILFSGIVAYEYVTIRSRQVLTMVRHFFRLNTGLSLGFLTVVTADQLIVI